MIVIDTSAIICILTDEPERRHFNELIQNAEMCYMSAATLLEIRIVLYARYGESAIQSMDAFILRSSIEVLPVTNHSSDLAFDAYRRFGKGTGHKAGLNYGDCFSYALAKEMGLPLLFKGNDFSHTNIVIAT